MLKAGRGLAQAHAPKKRIELPEGRGFGDDRPVNNGEQVDGERGVGLEAEKHIPAAGPGRINVRLLGVWDGGAGEPNLAVAEAGDGRHAAIDRPPPATAERHL